MVGVDITPQKRYPFRFILGDALEYVPEHGAEYDVIHASPPCQAYSVMASLSRGGYPDLIPQVREALRVTGKSFVIENVPGAPLLNPFMLCGTMFGLRVIRHRLFESFPLIWYPPACCNHWGNAVGGIEWARHKRRTGKTSTPGFRDGYTHITVCGNGYLAADGRLAMGIDWMTKKELSQAIPPAYTEWIGGELMRHIHGPA